MKTSKLSHHVICSIILFHPHINITLNNLAIADMSMMTDTLPRIDPRYYADSMDEQVCDLPTF